MLQPRKYKKKARYMGFLEYWYRPFLFIPLVCGFAKSIIDFVYKTVPIINIMKPGKIEIVLNFISVENKYINKKIVVIW